MIKLETYNGITVLRDDLLPGGTKSVLLPKLLDPSADEYVYASPVYGGFQIALSLYCQSIGKRATIFCAKRGLHNIHPNTQKCIDAGAKVIQVPYGYLSVIEARAREYVADDSSKQKLIFGAGSHGSISTIAKRMREVIKKLGREPKFIYCAVGSGTLVKGILAGTSTAIIHGVQVGKDFNYDHPRLTMHKYAKSFDKVSTIKSPFPSMPNYDLKAWEFCVLSELNSPGPCKPPGEVLFWNVL